MKNYHTSIVTGEVEFEISDSRFLSGRVYVLLKAAALKYPKMALADALDWAKKLDTQFCEQETIRKDAYSISLIHDMEISLEKTAALSPQ